MSTQIIKGWEGDVYIGIDRVIRVTGVDLAVDRGLEFFYEVGDIDPAEVKGGLNSVSGRIGRGTVNGHLLSMAIGSKSDAGGGVWEINSSDVLHPATSVSDEAIACDGETTIFELANSPVVKGTFVLESGGTPWGTEGVDYSVDYAYGILVFAVPQAADTWTCDYDYGRSFTMRLRLQVADGMEQRTDVTLRGCKFNTWGVSVANDGSTVIENCDFIAETADGLYV